MKKKISIAILIVLVVIQFIPFEKNTSNADVDMDILNYEQLNEKHEVHYLLKSACYDCHSNYTNYPWYSNIAPISFYLENHIRGAKKKLNFSEWKYYSEADKKNAAYESIEMIQLDHMPIKSYKLMHKEARLSESEKATLITFFESI